MIMIRNFQDDELMIINDNQIIELLPIEQNATDDHWQSIIIKNSYVQ